MPKRTAIELYRFVFSILICIHHFKYKLGWDILPSGYIFVEFFFCLSGFLLASTVSKENEHSTIRYLKKRIVRFYPEYAFSAIVMVLYLHFTKSTVNFQDAVAEILMVQGIGPFHGNFYNYPSWYITVLIAGSAILYAALSLSNRMYVELIGPVVVLAGYTYFSYAGLEHWGNVGFLYLPLVRAICGLTVGILAYQMKDHVKKLSAITAWVIKCLCLFVILLDVFTTVNLDMLAVLSSGVLVVLTLQTKGILESILPEKPVLYLGGLSYSIYLHQAFVIEAMEPVLPLLRNAYGLSRYMCTAIVILILIVYSAVVHKIIAAVSGRIRRRRYTPNPT